MTFENFGNWPVCQNCHVEETAPGDDLCYWCSRLPPPVEDIYTSPAEQKTFYSKQLLKRLVPALVVANHGLSETL